MPFSGGMTLANADADEVKFTLLKSFRGFVRPCPGHIKKLLGYTGIPEKTQEFCHVSFILRGREDQNLLTKFRAKVLFKIRARLFRWLFALAVGGAAVLKAGGGDAHFLRLKG